MGHLGPEFNEINILSPFVFLSQWTVHRVAKNQTRLKQLSIYMASQVAVVVKSLPANAGDVRDLGLILFIFFFILFSIMVFHRILNSSCAVK